MKIIFSTCYDQEVYKSSELHTQYAGPLRLLTILERELGLYQIQKTDNERADEYLICLEKCQEGSFYEASLETNGKGEHNLLVAKELLSYRDELILFNWDLNKDQEGRFRDFKEVELEFKKIPGYAGIADRWWRLINSLTLERINEFEIEKIQIEDPIEHLPFHLKALFEKLSTKTQYSFPEIDPNDLSSDGNNLSVFKTLLYNSIIKGKSAVSKTSKLNSYNSDKSLLVLKFKNKQQLYDVIARKAKPGECIVLNKENSGFDFSLVSFGKTASGSKQSAGNAQIAQLPRLVIPCFDSNVNLTTVISFLDLPKSPLDERIGYQLKKLLVKSPGFYNREWQSIVNAFNGKVFEKEELSAEEKRLSTLFETKEATEEELKDRQKQIDLFLSFYHTEEKASLKKAKAIYKYLKKWADGMLKAKTSLELKEQFNYVSKVCSAILKFDFDKKTVAQLHAKIQSECEQQKFTSYFKQVGSVDVYPDISSITSANSKTIYWIDFYDHKPKQPGAFLLHEEIAELGDKCNHDGLIKLQLGQWLKGLSKIKGRLVLCTVNDEETEKHPLHLRLESMFGKENCQRNITINIHDLEGEDESLFLTINDDSIQAPRAISLPQAKGYFSSDILKKIGPREYESASSIEKLIQYPFDWVMQYKAKFSNDVGFSLPDDNLIKGNVAHRVIEVLFSEHPTLDFEDNKRDKVFYETVREIGATFLQEDKRFDLSEFKYAFDKSLRGLADIIKLNNFSVKACEYNFGIDELCYVGEIENNVRGSIDLYLIDGKEEPFVIDLKWSYSDKKYKEKIKENEAIQLAIYSAAIKSRDMSKAAYYMLSQNLMLTAAEGLKGDNIFNIRSDAQDKDILEKIKNSYDFRQNEIKQKGKLEIGDNFSLEGLEYHIRSKDTDLINLPEDKKNKKEYPYSGYKLFKGSLK